MKKLLIACGLLLSGAASAQVQVEVIATAPDTVGRNLVFQVREKVARSSTIRAFTANSGPRLRLSVVTMDPDDDKSFSTIYSAVLTWHNGTDRFPLYLTNYVGTCGSNRVSDCADSLVAAAGEQADFISRAIRAATQDDTQ